MQVSTPRVATGSANSTTIIRCSKELFSNWRRVSWGDDVAQLSDKVQLTCIKEDRKSLVDELMTAPWMFRVVVTPEKSLATKADLQIPWKKLKSNEEVKNLLPQQLDSLMNHLPHSI